MSIISEALEKLSFVNLDIPAIIVRATVNNVIDEGLPVSGSKPPFDAETIEQWYDFVINVEGIVENLCDLKNISLSHNIDSLSEYIDFYVYDENGNKKEGIIDLRLSDHPQTTATKKLRKKSVQKIDNNYNLEIVTVNDKTFQSYREAIFYIRKLISDYTFK